MMKFENLLAIGGQAAKTVHCAAEAESPPREGRGDGATRDPMLHMETRRVFDSEVFGRVSALTMLRTRIVVALALVSSIGCYENTTIRSFPSGAVLTVNGQPAGTTPVAFQVPSRRLSADSVFRYRIEREGYRPAEGEFGTIVSTARIVGSMFSLGVSYLFRGVRVLPDSIGVDLEPLNTATQGRPSGDASARLHQVEDLFERGAITEEEYQRERARILRGL